MKVVQYVDSNLFAPKDAWSKLTAQEKADILRAGVENGYTKLSDIKEKYNEFAEGGDKLSRKPSVGPVDKEFMATRPTPFDILARTALNYSNQEFGHSFSSENNPSEPEPLNFDELKQRQRFMETGFNDNLTSSVGAKGRYQITDNTLAEYTKKTGKTGDLFDPTFNEAVRDWYMDESLENRSWITKGEPTDSVKYGKKLAAYNYGPTNVVRALEKAKAAEIDIYNTFDWLRFMPKETQDYVNFILRNKDVGKHKNQVEYDKAVKKLNKKEDGGPLDEETYWGGLLPTVDITYAAPSIYTKEGERLAKKMAADVYVGNMLLSDVPRDYYNYVEGEVKGAIPSKKIGWNAAKEIGLTAAGFMADPLVSPIIQRAGIATVKGINSARKYIGGTKKRLAEVILRGGDAMQYPHNVIEQIANKKALNYIFNPRANPRLAYQLPFRYSGKDYFIQAPHYGDIVDQFLGKVPVPNATYDTSILSKEMQDYINTFYKGKRIPIRDLGYQPSFTGKNYATLFNEIKGSKTPVRIGNFSTGIGKPKSVLDPGGFQSYVRVLDDNNILLDNADIWKFNPVDYSNRYLSKKPNLLKKLGLRFIDSQGTPIVHLWKDIEPIPDNIINNGLYKNGGRINLTSIK